MRIRITLYNFYLRTVVYSLPLIAFAIAFYIAFVAGARREYNPHEYVRLLIVTMLTWSMAVEHARLVSVSDLFENRFGLRSAVLACALTYAVISFVIVFSRLGQYSRIFIATSGIVLLGVTLVVRSGFRLLVANHRDHRRHPRILVIGADRFARRVVSRLVHGPLGTGTVVGHVRLPEERVAIANTNIFELSDLGTVAIDSGIDEIIVALPASSYSHVPKIMPALEELGVPVRLALDFGRSVVIREKLFQLGRLQMMDLKTAPAESITYLLLKRYFDIVFAAFALLIASPVMAAIAVVIWLTSPGPILFAQERVGLNGRTFRMLKFRTMRVSSGTESDTVWTTKADPRRTAFGTFLRKTSLDELPQFINVIRGDMSVVGPRPERPHFVQKFRHDYQNYCVRHRLRVGITGWAQVHGYRGDTSIAKRVEYDLYYLNNWSFLLDLKIICKTVVAGLISTNAY